MLKMHAKESFRTKMRQKALDPHNNHRKTCYTDNIFIQSYLKFKSILVTKKY